MREQPVIAKGNAETGCGQERRRNGELKPIDPEVPQIKGDRGERQKKRADQERACRPIDSIDWDSKNQRKRGVFQISARAARISKLIEAADRE